MSSYYKLRWWETASVQLGFLALVASISLWYLLAWPLRIVRGLWGTAREDAAIQSLCRARQAAWLQALAVAVVLVGALGLNEEIVFGVTAPLKIMLTASYLILLTVAFYGFRLLPLLRSGATPGAKGFHSFYITLGALFSADLAYWNLYGPYRW
ncbi:MAG: hypothetical protein AAGA68_18850 [Pseudomonadota bacterium]